MEKFAYASPATVKEAAGMLGAQWGEAEVLAGGTDLISLMKEYIATPKRVVNIKKIKELGRHRGRRRTACASARPYASTNSPRTRRSARAYPSLMEAALGVTSPQIRNMGTVGGDLCQRPRCWYYRQGFRTAGDEERQGAGAGWREQVSRHSGQQRAGVFRQPVEPRPGVDRAGRNVPAGLGHGEREVAPRRNSSSRPPANNARDRDSAERNPHRDSVSRASLG